MVFTDGVANKLKMDAEKGRYCKSYDAATA